MNVAAQQVPTSDAARCPLCGNANACALAARCDRPCWCVSAQFSAELLARVPETARGRACVCAACASAAASASAPAHMPLV